MRLLIHIPGALAIASIILWAFADISFWGPLDQTKLEDFFRMITIVMAHIVALGISWVELTVE